MVMLYMGLDDRVLLLSSKNHVSLASNMKSVFNTISKVLLNSNSKSQCNLALLVNSIVNLALNGQITQSVVNSILFYLHALHSKCCILKFTLL